MAGLKNNKICIVFVTIGSYSDARKLSLKLIEKKLAGCVNILRLEKSIYEWKGKICEDSEFLMLIKTGKHRLKPLTDFISKNHPYSVAEILTIQSDNVNKPYEKWLLDLLSDY